MRKEFLVTVINLSDTDNVCFSHDNSSNPGPAVRSGPRHSRDSPTTETNVNEEKKRKHEEVDTEESHNSQDEANEDELEEEEANVLAQVGMKKRKSKLSEEKKIPESYVTGSEDDKKMDDLNDEKSAKANHDRIIDEIQKARGQEVSAINNRLQQVVADNNLLQNNLQQEVAMRRNLELNHSQYQISIDNLNSQLEMAKMAANQAKAADPHFMVELEQLRTLRDKYENSLAEINVNNSNLKNQISQQAEEISSIKNQLSSSSDKVSQLTKSNTSLEQALAAKAEEAQKAAAELSSLKSKKPQEAILNNNNINVAAIESELASVKQKLVEKEKETVRLAEENERLGEQVNRIEK